MLGERLNELGPWEDVDDLVLLVVRLLRTQSNWHEWLDREGLLADVPLLMVSAFIFIHWRWAGFSWNPLSAVRGLQSLLFGRGPWYWMMKFTPLQGGMAR